MQVARKLDNAHGMKDLLYLFVRARTVGYFVVDRRRVIVSLVRYVTDNETREISHTLYMYCMKLCSSQKDQYFMPMCV